MTQYVFPEGAYKDLAVHFAAIAEVYAALANGTTATIAAARVDAEAAKAEAQPADAPAKRGRPAKTKTETVADDAPPIEKDKTVTADHPKRAELKTIAKAYSVLTSVPEAQKAMKLHGESSNLVPDADLDSAIVYFKNLVKKEEAAKAAKDDEAI